MGPFRLTILRFASLPSTNLEAARRAAEGASEGVCVVASEQTQGRGRLGRRWASPKDAGLYFSIIFRPTLSQSSWPLLTLMSALAVREALLESFDLPTDIKWPNDIIVNEKKLCGILAETVDTPRGSAVVVGIGINLTQDAFPSELEDVATSCEAVSKKPPDLEVVLEKLVNALSRRYEELHEPNGTVELLKEWCARSSYSSGKRVRVTDAVDSFIGTTRGLEDDGALKVETDDGQLKVIRAGDIASVRPWEREQ